MIGGEKAGPYTLDQLAEAGVTPDTYVWCKGMDDWQQAKDVADICRAFRQRLAGVRAGVVSQTASEPGSSAAAQEDDVQMFLSFRGLPEPEEQSVDYSNPPLSLFWVSVALTFLCFPFTGWVAMLKSYRSGKLWRDSLKEENRDRALDMKKEAYDLSRQSRMWAGITFFLGFILYAMFIGR